MQLLLLCVLTPHLMHRLRSVCRCFPRQGHCPGEDVSSKRCWRAAVLFSYIIADQLCNCSSSGSGQQQARTAVASDQLPARRRMPSQDAWSDSLHGSWTLAAASTPPALQLCRKLAPCAADASTAVWLPTCGCGATVGGGMHLLPCIAS
jgi:hypothetical protein